MSNLKTRPPGENGHSSPIAVEGFLATRETHSVSEFLEQACSYVSLDWQEHVQIGPKYYRPAEVDLLVGDAGKSEEETGLGGEDKV